ncbi:MAG: hypothetical protein JXB48_12740 [Candidatus Latescibacteria bacterium]|nr:hypothetical protein [Candidatus Latescibacterota bacterium]
MKRIIRYVAGTGFIILGIVGLFLPFLQGILFIITGLLILAPESKTIRRMIACIRLKYPEFYTKVRKLKRKKNGNKV